MTEMGVSARETATRDGRRGAAAGSTARAAERLGRHTRSRSPHGHAENTHNPSTRHGRSRACTAAAEACCPTRQAEAAGHAVTSALRRPCRCVRGARPPSRPARSQPPNPQNPPRSARTRRVCDASTLSETSLPAPARTFRFLEIGVAIVARKAARKRAGRAKSDTTSPKHEGASLHPRKLALVHLPCALRNPRLAKADQAGAQACCSWASAAPRAVASAAPWGVTEGSLCLPLVDKSKRSLAAGS